MNRLLAACILLPAIAWGQQPGAEALLGESTIAALAGELSRFTSRCTRPSSSGSRKTRFVGVLLQAGAASSAAV
jgi:hypothetical protein